MIIDLFAGPGGWSEGLRHLGHSDLGIEHDPSACATRAAAGHQTIRADVAAYPTGPFAGRITGLLASPPCQAFSQAGDRNGIGDYGRIVDHARRCEDRWHDYGPDGWSDARSPLVLEPLRWTLDLQPEWVACEQVPPVLPLWEVFGRLLERHGYKTWTGIINAADLGVPQTRERAFLLASRKRQPAPPEPTHGRDPHPVLFGAELAPWVSMADALGWPGTERLGFPRLDRGDSEDGYRERDWREADEPAFCLMEKARSWLVQTGNNSHVTSRIGSKAGDGGVELYERPVEEPAPTVDGKAGAAWRFVQAQRSRATERRRLDEPAPTLAFGHDAAQARFVVEAVNTGRAGGSRADAQQIPVSEPAPGLDSAHGGAGRWWWQTRPATTLAGDARCFSPGGHIANDGRDNEKMVGRSENAIRLSLADALVLQSFRPDYPVQGTKTAAFRQIGDAVCPRVAERLLAQFVEA